MRILVALEPRLGELLDEARLSRRTPGFCPLRTFYGRSGLRARMSQLVGHGGMFPAGHLMRSCEAYDAAYDALLSALPDCAHAGICG